MALHYGSATLGRHNQQIGTHSQAEISATPNLIDWQTNMTPQRSGFEVVRDPEDRETWRAIHDGRVTTPRFNSRDAAYAYLEMLERGQRKPEYSD